MREALKTGLLCLGFGAERYVKEAECCDSAEPIIYGIPWEDRV